MRTRKLTSRTVRLMTLAVLAAMVAGAGSARAQDMHRGTIATRQRSYTGDIRWRAASRVYSVTAAGQTIELAPRDVVGLRLEQPPAQLDQAVRAVREGQAAQAIPVLQRIMNAYTMLGPDRVAGRWLAQAHLDLGQAGQAVTAVEELLRNSPTANQDGDLMGVYVDALIKDGQLARAERALGDIIASGSRAAAAMAQVKRGDIQVQRGDMREALISGFLRTIILFQDIREVQPEALYKAIQAHTALNEHQYAERWRSRLLSNFPNSEYARRLARE